MLDKLRPKLEEMRQRFEELTRESEDPEVIAVPPRYTRVLKELGGLRPVVDVYRELLDSETELAQAEEMLADPEMAELARDEVETLTAKRDALNEAVISRFVLADDVGERDSIVEIRAGTGGEEAGLFAADLFKMYAKLAERRGWKIEVMDTNETDLGGYRAITFAVRGRSVFQELKYESGTHRVQRVPKTEAQGRIHTSAATVAVLPEAEEVDVDLSKDDYRVDTFCASGKGGQHVNRTESAVRLTHHETGIVVQCQDERSQHKNLARALSILRTRLFAYKQEQASKERADLRRGQVGSGDRSEKIRTYNWPQDRVTDHRLGQNFPLQVVIVGEMDKLLAALVEYDRQQRIAAL